MHCGTDLTGAANRRYCSDACRMRAYRRRLRGLPVSVPKAVRFGLLNRRGETIQGQTRSRIASSAALIASARARIAESRHQVEVSRGLADKTRSRTTPPT
jgi:hypothetical protein